MRKSTTHYQHDGSAACTARIRPPWLTADADEVSCGNCQRTDAWKHGTPAAAVLPPPRDDAVASPADRRVLLEWMGLAG
jgi:hypothetical protein